MNNQIPQHGARARWPGEREPDGSDAESAYRPIDASLTATFKNAMFARTRLETGVEYLQKDELNPLLVAETSAEPVRLVPPSQLACTDTYCCSCIGLPALSRRTYRKTMASRRPKSKSTLSFVLGISFPRHPSFEMCLRHCSTNCQRRCTSPWRWRA